MKIGITGHQDRKGIQWKWVEDVLRSEIKKLPHVSEALTSLAVGSDQLFAEIALSLAVPVTAVIPMSNYEKFFSGREREKYYALLAKARHIQLKSSKDSAQAFLDAGKYIVNESDVLFAVWDGEKADGVGGTGDIVKFALCRMKSIVHIDPIEKTVSVY